MNAKCDCLHEYDTTLAHYNGCDLVYAGVADVREADSSSVRTLAELASVTDIDTALMCLRELTGGK